MSKPSSKAAVQEHTYERQPFLRRTAIPAIYIAALIALCVAVTGMYFIEIEDHYANMLFGGGYGAYDAYAANIHPWLGQLIAWLYGLASGVNWFGTLLLALTFLAGAGALSLAARRKGGLLPGIVVLSPILIVMVSSIQSRVVAAMCVITGALMAIDSHDDTLSIPRLIIGNLLVVFGAALSYRTGVILAALTVICAGAGKSFPVRGKKFWSAVPLVIVLACSTTLTSGLNSEWRAFNNQYMSYEDAQASYLGAEVNGLSDLYGEVVSLDGGTSTSSPTLPEDESVKEQAMADSSLSKLGWSLNDGQLFTLRSTADSELTSPEAVQNVQHAARWFSTDGFGARLWETLGKLQFLMMIGLFLLCALVIETTNRGRGWITLLSAIAAFGGHAAMILINRTSFRDIAPFYMLGILTLMADFDPKASAEQLYRIVSSKLVRGLVATAVMIGFVGAAYMLLYNLGEYNRQRSPSLAAAEELADLMDHMPGAVFIGDNPLDRFNPDALKPPRKDAFSRMIGGSYDLYSPRRAALMERFNLENPLLDAVDREDVIYVDMSITAMAAAINRLGEYGVAVKTTTPTDENGVQLSSLNAEHRMQLYWLQSVPQEDATPADPIQEDSDSVQEDPIQEDSVQEGVIQEDSIQEGVIPENAAQDDAPQEQTPLTTETP
ncbi:MAG: hypothetical protein LBK46_02335 [Oscillospiraceae bacterium]|jgi:hypothetical protein|nr:hypothetical protein [Oscillospiraceae bacterium]